MDNDGIRLSDQPAWIELEITGKGGEMVYWGPASIRLTTLHDGGLGFQPNGAFRVEFPSQSGFEPISAANPGKKTESKELRTELEGADTIRLADGRRLHIIRKIDKPAEVLAEEAAAEAREQECLALEQERLAALFTTTPGTVTIMDWVDVSLESMKQTVELCNRLEANGWEIRDKGTDDHCLLLHYRRFFESGAVAEAVVRELDDQTSFYWEADGQAGEVSVYLNGDGSATFEAQ